MFGGNGVGERHLLGGGVSVDQLRGGLQPHFGLVYPEYELNKSLESRHIVRSGQLVGILASSRISALGADR